MNFPIALGMPGGAEWIIIAAIGLLFFGKRLPEVGRSLGKGIVEFKKGLKGVEDEVEKQSDPQPQNTAPAQLTSQTAEQKPAASSPYKFDPYTGKPTEGSATTQG
jgi:sec-independent protein translocase protein TatA